MTLPNSGDLTLGDIQAEFGGSFPASLGEYYAGGAYVPSGTVGDGGPIPESGTISIGDFYGASAIIPDFTPDAVNWADSTGFVLMTTGNQTLTGFNQTITLRLSSSNIPSNCSVIAYKNAAQLGEITSASTTYDFTVDSGDIVYFLGYFSGTPPLTVNCSVNNQSDSGALLDTFALEFTEDGNY